ncbi:MAG: hypothetical protein CMN55_15445 [Sneathiella sp.]|uniref:MFS transporter n=1 Tax=Sneathiella sp. TaxID=1964365 RepID=UPI000C4BF393|nr:MFS transporter [Sneathiella sp.]MAL80473.1 hypothetical protein [Sneathiella sp.]
MSSEPRDALIRNRAVYIFLICAILFGLGQFHRSAGAVIMPPIAVDIGVPVSSLGIAAAALFFASAIVQVPMGIALDRFGSRLVLSTVTLFGALGALLLASADSLNDVIIARVMIGLGYSAVMMASYVLFAKWFPPEKFATIASWLMAFSSFGAIMSSAPLAYAIEVYGWRIPCIAAAVLTVVMIGIGSIVIRDTPPGYQESAEKPATFLHSLRGYWAVLTYPRFLNLLGMGFVSYGPSTALMGMWGGPYLEFTYDMDALSRGNVILLMAVTMPLGALFFGFIDRKVRSRKKIVITASSSVLVTFLILGFTTNMPVWLTMILFAYISFTQQYYVVLAAHCRTLFPDYMVGRANSTLNLIAILGVGFMQSLYGWILAASPDNGFTISFFVVAGILTVTLLIYSGSVEKTPTVPRKV